MSTDTTVTDVTETTETAETETTVERTEETGMTLDQAFQLWHAAQAASLQARLDESHALEMIGKVAGTKTFVHEGQLYQVRLRRNKELSEATGEEVKLAFLCALEREPRDWLRDARQKLLDEAAAKGAAEASATPVVTQEPAEALTEGEDLPAPVLGHRAVEGSEGREGGALDTSSLFGGSEVVTEDEEVTVVLD